MQTLRNEGVRGVYKGATPPLVGWMFMDSIMLGSLSVYRRVLNDNFFNPHSQALGEKQGNLPVVGHAMAGVLAGWTVSFVAGPVEHVKARLQVQYAADKAQRLYSGPIDCLKKIVMSLFPTSGTASDNRRSATMAFAASIMASSPPCSSAPSSASGGAATRS